MKIICLSKYLLGFLALKLCLAIAWASALAIMQPQLILHTSPIAQATIWTFFVLIPISAVLEEGAFRYAIFRILKRLGNERLLVFLLVSSAISALVHLANVQYAGTLGMACYFLIQFISSLYLAFVFAKMGILASSFVHAASNLTILSIGVLAK